MIKKLLNISILAICLFIFTTPVLADVCTEEELESLKTLADKIEISHEFEESIEGNHSFDVKAYNLSSKFYLKLPNGMDFITDENQGSLGSFLDGEKLKVEIYASENTNCEDEFLTTKSLELPTYNEYSKRAECKNNKELEVCKEWTDTDNLTEEDFLKILQEQQKSSLDHSDSKFTKFVKQYAKYIAITVVVIVAIISVYILIRNKKRAKIDI